MLIQKTSAKSADELASPTITPLATIGSKPRFYLVGEADRSTRRSSAATDGRTSVSINGRWHMLRGKTATYEQLLDIAFRGQPNRAWGVATVIYRHGARNAPDGLLTPGDVIPLSEGLLVNATVTYAS